MPNAVNKFTIPIKGMHCKSCELLIEDAFKGVKGVVRSRIDHRRAEAEIFYVGEKPDPARITEAVTQAGYAVGQEEKRGLISRNKNEYKELGIAFLILLGAYYILKGLGINSVGINTTADDLSVPIVFLVGLTAGVSTCMALVGGLVLGLSAKHSEMHPEATPLEKFRPHLFFNLGRVLSFAFFGGLLGLLGSAIQLSSFGLGILTIAVGFVMLIMGLQLIEIFPGARRLKFTLPKSISRVLGINNNQKEYSHKGSMLMGGLTFFLPCGFTQAMQVFAVGSGNFFLGAAIMGIFALGTLPGLLSLGGLVSAVKGAWAGKFFKFSGLVVIAFAVFNISNGLNLTGWNFSYGQAENINSNDPNVVIVNGAQVVSMKETNSGYVPNNFTIRKGLPVRWVITAEAPYSCAASLVMPKYNIRKNLKSGENIIEFTPTEAGTVKFSCSMGMYTGSFNVVEK